MKPIPAARGIESPVAPVANPETQPAPVSLPGTGPSSGNRRHSPCAAHRAYPFLLVLSTGVALLFCLLYVTKPIIPAAQPMAAASSENPPPPSSSPSPEPNTQAPAEVPPTTNEIPLMPPLDKLPGEIAGSPTPPATTPPATVPPTAPVRSIYEETNLRMQHILTAKAPGGHVSRIDLEVPVLYQSRNLHWSSKELERARELMTRLMDYQDKTRELRNEGEKLLTAWNELVGTSIPTPLLRADSPSLTDNQTQPHKATPAAASTPSSTIQIETNP